jgi:hypothetical protein
MILCGIELRFYFKIPTSYKKINKKPFKIAKVNIIYFN